MKSVTAVTPERLPASKPAPFEPVLPLSRRRFLKTAVQVGALLAAPQIVRGAVVGRDGGVAPSDRIVLGAIGIGNRGSYDLGCFLEEPDVPAGEEWFHDAHWDGYLGPPNGWSNGSHFYLNNKAYYC